MAPRRPDKKSKKRDKAAISRAAAAAAADGTSKPVTPEILVKAAEYQLQAGNVQDALTLAEKALEQSPAGSDDELSALNLLGQISLEAGEFEAARAYFLRAVAIDGDGTKDEATGGGPEKFLCLAQLSEEGGKDSVTWFERGAAALRKQIQTLEDARRRTDEQTMQLDELKKKLAMTLCSVAEVYMTDLSWEEDAEPRCEALVTEATLVAPDFAETWQTLANVRISQERFDDAKAALTRSLELWKDLPPQDPAVPDFPSRVALARLLMEVEMEQEAIEVLERLVGEDDQSVEVWYLGGWGLYVMGEKQKKETDKAGGSGSSISEEDWKASWISSRVWLNQCQHLYKLQDYEDERLGEHAQELLGLIAKELGEAPAGEDEDEDWEDEEDEEDGSDEEMKD
ncbi:TPR domain-containing protein [Daldinia caldariorum]|uniref:TPR domain-containing protein n=1 Tax=Daldinia caldariorum TaxID=326644 RepID=UPI002008DE67|nr:TPR domain-containing protein [Daldinia caldariorum]KAI1467328.1 TPR domain-containing protein [Daldinia caldariorum]